MLVTPDPIHGVSLPMQVLIFSHSVRMLRIIQKMMTAKGYAYVVLDGSTPQVSLCRSHVT